MAANVLGMAFVPYYNHLMNLLETNKELKKTATGIFMQVAWGAGGTIAGGVVGGPVGAMVGGIAGSVIGYCLSDEYQSMIKVLKELTDEDKKRLVNQVQEVVGSSGIEALTRFIRQQAQREILLNVLNKFTTDLKGG
ncbi:protein C19orf12 homolog [Haliotis asinina]|uniref:protein C19orf12 homolog n=1 Tax=Haliotis asinina TaxID=109174 RepID=UPI0035326521